MFSRTMHAAPCTLYPVRRPFDGRRAGYRVQGVACAIAVCFVLVLLPTSHVAAQGGGWDLRGGVLGYFSERSATFEGDAGLGSGTLGGVEISGRSRFVGGYARLFKGSFSASIGDEAIGDIGRADVGIVAGPSVIAAELGYAVRTYSGAFGSRRWSFVRLGGQSTQSLGSTGLHASVAVAFYLGVNESQHLGSGSGRDLETRLTFTPASLPLYAALGYRFERFTADYGTDSRPEEISGLVMVVGARVRL